MENMEHCHIWIWKLHLSTYWKERRIILNRPKNNKIRRPQFLCIVGCEGKNQERIYFDKVAELVNCVEERTHDLVFDYAEPYGGNPKCVVERTIQKSIGKENKVSVFDYDGKKDKYEEAIDLAIENKIELGYTNYCFDLWLILHKEDYFDIVQNQDAYADKLRQVFGLAADANIKKEKRVTEIVNQIGLSDIKNAIEMMPNQIYPAGNAMAGHATKYAAEALAARVFLFYTGRYDKKTLPLTPEGEITKEQVISWLEDHSGHNLISDQRNLWGYTNSATNSTSSKKQYAYAVKHKLAWDGNSSIETLFANKHNLTSTWTYTWFANTCAMFYSPSGDDADWKEESYPFNFGWGAGPVSPSMVQDWKEWSKQQTFLDGYTEDPRISGSIWSYKAMDPNNEGNVLADFRLDDSEPAYTVSYRYYEQTGYFNKKYININAYNSNGVLEAFGKTLHPGISSQTSPQLLNITDLIHIRFADVLLMHSELKGDATGLNRVRQRSHLAPISYTLDALKQERRWEFAFESIRWWDLLRWSGPSLEEAGNALNRQTGFEVINAAALTPMVKYDYKKRLQQTQGYWPIPQIEIDRSNGVLEQNPGWGPDAQFSDWTKM